MCKVCFIQTNAKWENGRTGEKEWIKLYCVCSMHEWEFCTLFYLTGTFFSPNYTLKWGYMFLHTLDINANTSIIYIYNKFMPNLKSIPLANTFTWQTFMVCFRKSFAEIHTFAHTPTKFSFMISAIKLLQLPTIGP